jgi:hypothetical protein
MVKPAPSLICNPAAGGIFSARHRAFSAVFADAPGLTSDLRRVIEREKVWEKHGVSVETI